MTRIIPLVPGVFVLNRSESVTILSLHFAISVACERFHQPLSFTHAACRGIAPLQEIFDPGSKRGFAHKLGTRGMFRGKYVVAGF